MAFAAQLADDLGHPVQINAYITPPQSQGFSAHYDVHDVFVLQIAGEKQWFIHEPVFESPLRSQPWNDRSTAVAEAATQAPVIDTVLRPGDALYLPRGYLHSAKALGGVSVHLTVGIHPVTRYALVEALLALAADDLSLRTSLPLGVDLSDPKAVSRISRPRCRRCSGGWTMRARRTSPHALPGEPPGRRRSRRSHRPPRCGHSTPTPRSTFDPTCALPSMLWATTCD